MSTASVISARSGRVTGHPASATSRLATMSGGSSSGWRELRRLRQSARSRSTPASRNRARSIAFTAPPSRQLGVLLLGVARAPGQHDRAVDRAAAGGPDLEAARLGHDREVGGDAMPGAGQAADAAGLLVGVRAHDQIAGEAARRRDGFCGDDHRGDAALHVARAAADDAAVANLRVEGIVVPAVLAPRRDHVDVAVEQQRAAAARAAQARSELRAPVEADPARRAERMARHVLRRRLPHFDLGARGPQAGGKVLLERGLVAGGRGGVRPAGGVEPDQVAQQRHELAGAGGDRVDEPPLVTVECLGHRDRPSRARGRTRRSRRRS